ncbi:MAG TPA: hypothetical protein ENJ28_02220 [Gammaproteobacteria bacterium]|nr:hypothetical protein [Gammaproteobacteria bacterium]
MKKIIETTCLVAFLLISGCATIVGDKTQTIPISSTPSDASVVITDEKGVQVFKGKTPTSVTLNKSDGSYWGKKSFTVNITKPGFGSQVIPIKASANGLYIAGNFLFGGLIGWFIVDPMNGAMYTLSPEQIASTLGGKAAKNYSHDDGSISVMLIQDVPVSLRNKMTRIN